MSYSVIVLYQTARVLTSCILAGTAQAFILYGQARVPYTPSFHPLPFQPLFAIFIPSVVEVGQVVQPRQPWLCAVPPEKYQSEKMMRF
ncbi:hypothetical protein K3120_004087 [Salmonella enterica]|nr:hypothetical protein [Salmonella enterica]EDU4666443.1 hypothetical protein [Salmonella enterica subsp. arizonae]EEU7557033.1 hypothetical protein [Salmonella enterica]EHX7449931.1 hypothetical protein [Salmonella enterica]EKH8076874.1 hypothetical protein [Salmonella enterica]